MLATGCHDLCVTYTPGPAVAKLSSLREVISWAVGAFATDEALNDVYQRVHSENPELAKAVTWESGRSARKQVRTLTYGECPGPVHTYWFVRFGMMNVGSTAEVDRLRSDDPGQWQKVFARGVKARNYFDQEASYKLDAFFSGVGITDPDVQTWIRQMASSTAAKGRGKPTDGVLPFSQQNVMNAISETRGSLPAIFAGTPALQALPNEAHRTVHAARLSAPPALCLIAPDGRELVPTWHANRLILTDAVQGTPEEGVLVDSRGRLVAYQIGSHLVMGDVNRVTATISAWSSPVDLATLGDGSVLAIGCAGQYGALFVFSDSSSTWLCCATPDASARRLFNLADTASRTAALHGAYALLGTAREDGDAVECARFPGLDVEWLRFAAAGGHSLLIAGGRSLSGDEGTWLSLDGASPRSGPEASALKLPLSGHEPPSLTNSEIEWASTASPIIFDHWFHPTHGSRLRTA